METAFLPNVDRPTSSSYLPIMSRVFSFILLALMLAVPTLCMGDVLEHGCQHEDVGILDDDCGDASEHDPCVSYGLPQDRDTQKALDFELSWVPIAPCYWELAVDVSWRSWTESAPLPPDWTNLPYKASDRPLRI